MSDTHARHYSSLGQRSGYHILSRFACVMLVAMLQACAHSSLFSPYPQQAESYRLSLASGVFEAAHPGTGRDALLHLLEQGRVAQVAGDFDTSQSRFEEAIAAVEQTDLRAQVRLSEGLNQGAALLTNDNILPYEMAAYERIFLHHWQALNYLAKQQPEGAAVELRRARLEQQVLAEQYEAELAEAQAKARDEGLSIPDELRDISGLETGAADIKSAIQSAYTFLFSSAFWEARGDRNAALVDAKLALETNPENPQLLAHIKRLESGKTNDKAQVWLFVEQGFVASKTAKQISFPNFHGELITISLPGYDTQTLRAPGLTGGMTTGGENTFASFSTISDVSHMAAQHLATRLPGIYLRQALRALAKQQMQEQVGQNLGGAAKLLTMVYSVATERADLRSWLTLPHRVYAMREEVTAGSRQIQLQVGGAQYTLDVTLKPNQTLLLRAIHTGQNLQVQQFVL